MNSPYSVDPELSQVRPESEPPSVPDAARVDPLVRSAFREALLVSGIWFTAAVWSITVCYTMGYRQTPAELRLVLGFPDWIFYGIVVPWTTCTVISCWFGLVFVRDGDLGVEVPNEDDLGLGG